MYENRIEGSVDGGLNWFVVFSEITDTPRSGISYQIPDPVPPLLRQKYISREDPDCVHIEVLDVPSTNGDPAPDPWDHPDEYVKWFDRQTVKRQEREARAQTDFNSRMKAGERRLRQQPERWAEYERLVVNNPDFKVYLTANHSSWLEIYTNTDPAEAALELAQWREGIMKEKSTLLPPPAIPKFRKILPLEDI